MAPGTLIKFRPASRPRPLTRSTAEMTEPSTPKRSFKVGTEGRVPCPQNHTDVASGLPAARRAWFTGCSRRISCERRVRSRSKSAPAPFGQMLLDGLARDVVRRREVGRRDAAAPHHQMAVADAVEKLDAVAGEFLAQVGDDLRRFLAGDMARGEVVHDHRAIVARLQRHEIHAEHDVARPHRRFPWLAASIGARPV